MSQLDPIIDVFQSDVQLQPMYVHFINAKRTAESNQVKPAMLQRSVCKQVVYLYGTSGH